MKWMASAAAVVAMSVVGGCASGPRAPATGNVAGSAAQTAVAEGSGTTPRAAAGATANAAPSATAKAELGATANAASGATAHAEQGASANAAPGATANAGPGGTANAGPGGTANVGPGGAARAPLPAAAASGTTAHAGPASTPAPADATAKPINRALIAQGYQPSTYRGQLYYCRKEKLTGSQFTHRVCLTEQEAALQERIAQDEMNKRNSVGKCLPPLCPNH